MTPVHHSVGYTYEDTEDLDAVFAGTSDNPVYTRYGNPTVSAFETAVAALEGGEAALAYGSGMAAIHAALAGRGRAGRDGSGGGARRLRRDLRLAQPAAGDAGRDASASSTRRT